MAGNISGTCIISNTFLAYYVLSDGILRKQCRDALATTQNMPRAFHFTKHIKIKLEFSYGYGSK